MIKLILVIIQILLLVQQIRFLKDCEYNKADICSVVIFLIMIFVVFIL